MTNDQKALPGLIPKPYWGMKTSVIDMALTPELLDHILRTNSLENSVRKNGINTFNRPNTPMITEAGEESKFIRLNLAEKREYYRLSES